MTWDVYISTGSMHRAVCKDRAACKDRYNGQRLRTDNVGQQYHVSLAGQPRKLSNIVAAMLFCHSGQPRCAELTWTQLYALN